MGYVEMAVRIAVQIAKSVINLFAKEDSLERKVLVIAVGSILGIVMLTVAATTFMYGYFMCTGVASFVQNCDQDPIPNKEVTKLAKLMYEQRKDAGVDGGDLFRLKDEGIGGENFEGNAREDVRFTEKPFKTSAKQLNSRLRGVAKNKGDVYMAAGEKYGVNPAFVAAVSMLESGNGTSSLAKNRNNVGGITCASSNPLVKSCFKSSSGREWSEYKSVDDSIYHMAEILDKNCAKKGKATIIECWEIYSPPHDGNLSWGPDVVDMLKQMADNSIVFNIGDAEKDPGQSGESSDEGSESSDGKEDGPMNGVDVVTLEETLDEAEIWVRILSQIDSMAIQTLYRGPEQFEKGRELEGSTIQRTYAIAKDKYGGKSDFGGNETYYMMKTRFDLYTCYFLENNSIFVDYCKGKNIEAYFDDEHKGVVAKTVKSGDSKTFAYTKMEMLDEFAPYSMADEDSYIKLKDYYLKLYYEGKYGPEMGGSLIPSATWIVPMEKGTYNYASGFRTPDRPNHNGVDMGTLAVERVPVYAAASGKVISVGRNNGGYGGIVTLDHGNGYYTQYSHFWTEDIVVRYGQTVQQGQLLGGAGNDTVAFGGVRYWHLHFEICQSLRDMTGTNLKPGKGPLKGCNNHINPEKKEFGFEFSTSQDLSLTKKRAGSFADWKKKAMNGETIILPGFTPAMALGNLSSKYENGGDAGSCSSGIGDPGGVSCGKYQLATNPGTLGWFVDWTKKSYPKIHSELKKNSPGSQAFVASWKKVYKADPTGFATAQYQFIYETHYLKQVDGINSRIGLDVRKRHHAIQEMTFSMAVHRNNVTPANFESALGKERWKKMSDAELVKTMYEWWGNKYTCCTNRFKNQEKKDALALLKSSPAKKDEDKKPNPGGW